MILMDGIRFAECVRKLYPIESPYIINTPHHAVDAIYVPEKYDLYNIDRYKGFPNRFRNHYTTQMISHPKILGKVLGSKNVSFIEITNIHKFESVSGYFVYADLNGVLRPYDGLYRVGDEWKFIDENVTDFQTAFLLYHNKGE